MIRSEGAPGSAARHRARSTWLLVLAAFGLGPILLPAANVLAQSAPVSKPTSDIVLECEDYQSELLEGHIRICPGTVWPERTDKLLLPLMAACKEKFKGKTVLDIGTGSGIIGLYAAQLGAKKVIGTDIEDRAIACAQENARRLGVEKVFETRLVSLKDTSAFSVAKPGETFDIIISFPYCMVDRHPSLVSGTFDDGIEPDDSIRFGLSILNGLREHLSPDGACILAYRFAVEHTMMVRYAQHLGYSVEHHPALLLPLPDWYAMYNTFAFQVAQTDHVEPGVLMLSRMDSGPGEAENPGDPGGPGSGVYVKVDYSAEKGVAFPPLWGKQLDRVLPGIIVIRKQAARSGGSSSPPGVQHQGTAGR